MFEYTPLDIGKGLEELGPTVTTYLETLPTFLCSEVSNEDGAIELLPVLKTPSLVFLWNREVCHGETEVHARVQA